MPSHFTPIMNEAPQRTFEAVYQGFIIKYRPQSLGRNDFMAYTIVSREYVGRRYLCAVLQDLPTSRTQGEAASLGRVAGMHWVDAFNRREPGHDCHCRNVLAARQASAGAQASSVEAMQHARPCAIANHTKAFRSA